MGSIKEAINLRNQLNKEWVVKPPAKPNLDKCGELLNKLKIALTNLQFLPASMQDTSDELTIARDVLEIGAFWSIQSKKNADFERYMAQLKCYYFDYKTLVNESKHKDELLGLNLLYLLSQSRTAEFHSELELFAFNDDKFLDNKHISYVVQIERYLIEGRYNKVFDSTIPSPSFKHFLDSLLGTVREEISNCVEKSYKKMKSEALVKALNLQTANELKTFAVKKNWKYTANDDFYHFEVENKEEEKIPSFKLAKQFLEYAIELEKII